VVEHARTLLRDLARIRRDASGARDLGLLSSRMIALDAADSTIQTAALQLSSAYTAEALDKAVMQAELAALAVVRRRLTAASRDVVPRDPWQGQVSDELRRGGVR
jgi:hypothetical protein